MPKFAIERDLLGLGSLSSDEPAATASHVQWIQSYVTPDKLYCVYWADDAAAVREHVRRGGSPADAVNVVEAIIAPATGETG
jgi:Protein of unknown function (DUF4242)